MASKGDILSSVEEFLKHCEQSGDVAYGAVRSVLERLEDPKTRAQARIFLSDLQKKFPTEEEAHMCLQKFHFQIEDIILDQYEGASFVSIYYVHFVLLALKMMIKFVLSFG